MYSQKRLDKFLKEDRRWKRHVRIAHAKLQISRTSHDERDFWVAVLMANEE